MSVTDLTQDPHINILSTELDECQLGLDSCNTNAECIDTEDSYRCICSNGFSGDGLSTCDSELLFNDFTIVNSVIFGHILFSHQI